MAANGDPITLEDGWGYVQTKVIGPLKNILDEGLDNHSGKLFNNHDYINGYTKIYQMCTQRSPYNWAKELYKGHSDTIVQYVNESVLPALQSRTGENLLKEMNRRWENHKILNLWMMNFFLYLDRYYIQYQNLPALKSSGLTKFKELVFDAIKSSLTDAMVALIDLERDGTMIDQDLVRSCVTLFEAMGMNTLEAYSKDFEAPLLEATRSFYVRRTADWVQNDPTPVYLTKLEGALESEEARVETYLNAETLPKMMRVLEEEGLEKRQSELLCKENSGCAWLLKNEKMDDLARMYRMFARLPEGLAPMAAIVKDHITALGNDEMDRRVQRTAELGEKEKESADDPIFIKALLVLHEKYTEIVRVHFCSNALFQKAMFEAFKDVVNRDEGKFKNAELVSTFCDRILKTGGEKLSEDEVEGYLDKVVLIFKYLTDKDMFAEIYRNQLAKRLLNQRSASDDMERQMIGKLKKEATQQFTSKMEGMMNDLSIGVEHATRFDAFFKEYKERPENVATLGKIDFTVQILTQGHWPSYKAFEPQLPAVMSQCLKVFSDNYLSHDDTAKRRLTWQWTLGGASVKATYGRKSYDLQVSTLQAVLLSLFSGCDEPITLKEVESKMGIKMESMKRVLHSLLYGKYKILKRIPGEACASDSKAKGSINDNDSFYIDPNFTSPMKRIRIPMASLEDSHNPKRVEEDRGISIEAAAVRIMKARKTLTHQQLMAEVLTQLAFFKPSPKDIKKHIESLIDRDYLERDINNSNTYKYLA